jgi:hypothetical protein
VNVCSTLLHHFLLEFLKTMSYRCAACNELLDRRFYSHAQLGQSVGTRRCLDCVRAARPVAAGWAEVPNGVSAFRRDTKERDTIGPRNGQDVSSGPPRQQEHQEVHRLTQQMEQVAIMMQPIHQNVVQHSPFEETAFTPAPSTQPPPQPQRVRIDADGFPMPIIESRAPLGIATSGSSNSSSSSPSKSPPRMKRKVSAKKASRAPKNSEATTHEDYDEDDDDLDSSSQADNDTVVTTQTKDSLQMYARQTKTRKVGKGQRRRQHQQHALESTQEDGEGTKRVSPKSSSSSLGNFFEKSRSRSSS